MARQATKITFPFFMESEASDSLGDHSDDVFNIKFNLVFEGTNKNGDHFTVSELEQNYRTLVNKPITWEHGEPNIGTITDAWLIPADGNTPMGVGCQATIWAYRYPEYADYVAASAKLGETGFGEAASHAMSMEVYFADADYVIGDWEQVVPFRQDTGILEMMRGREFGGKKVFRVLKQIVFGGAGVVEEPAERRAVLLAVASNRSLATGEPLFSDLDEKDFALPGQRLLPMNTDERLAASLAFFDNVMAAYPEVHPLEFEDAKDRLTKLARERGITNEVITHLRRDYKTMGSETPNTTNNMKEESETMADKDTTEQVVEEAVAEEAAVEEAPVVEETASEKVEEPKAEEAEATETPEMPDAMAEIKSVLDAILAAVKPPVAEEETASVDEEKDELTVAKEEISALKQQLADLASDKAKVEASLVGQQRLVLLKEAGIQVEQAAEEAKRDFLASLAEEAWKTYLTDVKTAASTEASVEDSPEINEASAALVLEDEKTEDTPLDKYNKLWKSTRIARP